MTPLVDFVRTTPFFVVAHRGASGDAPENTLAAIRTAVDGGANMVEIDLQLTLDRKLVVFHDHVLGRTTNGHGKIAATSFDDVRKLDAGSWFASSFAGERVPTFAEVVDVVRNRAYVLVELKPFDAQATVDDVRAVVTTVQEFGLGPYMAFASFDHRTIAFVKHLDATLHTVALNVPGDLRPPSEVCAAVAADAYGCSIHELSRDRMADARRNRIPVGVYTVNDEASLRRACSYGVQAVVSNFPSVIRDAALRICQQ